uniref:Uncharacterized protein n=1 Tax=Ixodes ricinus TaxID=34613 RepID=A0A6B0UCN4_IXORI
MASCTRVCQCFLLVIYFESFIQERRARVARGAPVPAFSLVLGWDSKWSIAFLVLTILGLGGLWLRGKFCYSSIIFRPR